MVRQKSPVAGFCLPLGRRAVDSMCRAGEESGRLRAVCVCWGVGHRGRCVVSEDFSGTIWLIQFNFLEVYFLLLFLFFKK